MKQVNIIYTVLTICCALFYNQTAVTAQNIITLTDSIQRYKIGEECFIATDSAHNFAIGDISSPSQQWRFRKSNQLFPNFGFTKLAYWIRFTVKNTTKSNRAWTIEGGSGTTDSIEMYLPDGHGQFLVHEAGDWVPFTKREIEDRRIVFPLDLPKDSVMTVYIRVAGEGPKVLMMIIRSVENLHQQNIMEWMYSGIFIGVMLFAALYNIIIFFSIRNKVYLYYVMHIIVFSCVILTIEGEFFQWLYPSHPGWNDIVHHCLLFTMSFVGLLFTREFLNTSKYVRRLDKVMIAGMVACVIFFVWLLFFNMPTRLSISISSLINVFYVPVVILAAFISWRSGYLPARFYLLAWTLLLVTGFFNVLTAIGVVPYHEFWTSRMLSSSGALEVVMLSFALADRINIMRQNLTSIQHKRIAEQAKSEATERLLHNILPKTIADQMMKKKTTISDYFDNVSIFFSDIVDFTNLSAQITPYDLVKGLNVIFTEFDKLARKHGLEKIKTIGDAYMAVCGAPELNENHAERVALFALDVCDAIKQIKFTEEKTEIHIRIGLNCGSVVAGVIGENKFMYDMWGDAVNTAARMESHGVPDKIHVSEYFKKCLEQSSPHKFYFIERGEMEIKGKGMMKTYFLEKA
ncbi:MAG: hypothetical protein JST20_02525 [Bacteroidetes bacterium]|nr:hypothetical protein [Bacteroidota bacterium]